MNFPSQMFFNDLNHGYRSAILKKNSSWLLTFVAVATKFHYEKVRRTMGTGIASYLLNVHEKSFITISHDYFRLKIEQKEIQQKFKSNLTEIWWILVLVPLLLISNINNILLQANMKRFKANTNFSLFDYLSELQILSRQTRIQRQCYLFQATALFLFSL